jgi:hypothetical protein
VAAIAIYGAPLSLLARTASHVACAPRSSGMAGLGVGGKVKLLLAPLRIMVVVLDAIPPIVKTMGTSKPVGAPSGIRALI